MACADITINATTAGKASIINVGDDSLTQLKGNRLRTEQTVRGDLQVLLIDIDGRRFITLSVMRVLRRLERHVSAVAFQLFSSSPGANVSELKSPAVRMLGENRHAGEPQ